MKKTSMYLHIYIVQLRSSPNLLLLFVIGLHNLQLSTVKLIGMHNWIASYLHLNTNSSDSMKHSVYASFFVTVDSDLISHPISNKIILWFSSWLRIHQLSSHVFPLPIN